MTLTRRLLLLVAIASLGAVAIQTYNEFDLRRSRTTEARSLALHQAQLAASEMAQIIARGRQLLTVVAQVPSIRALDTATCVPFLHDLQLEVSHLLTIAALDLDGRVRCRQEPPPSAPRFADRPYFQDAIAANNFVIGEYTEGRVVGRPVLPLAVPLHDHDGRIAGVVAAALDLHWLSRHPQARSLPGGDSVTVADRNGVILARAPHPERFVGTRIPDPYRHLLTARQPGALEITSQDGQRRMLG
jgi:C4-dicarboxylate-specific signal transduction histidine kinase